VTLARRIGVDDLNHGSSRLRIQGFIGYEQGRSRRQYPIKPGREFGRQFDSGKRHRIYLGTFFAHVPRHADSQPTKFGRIGNVGIGDAARAVCEHQCMIDQRCIAGNGQSRSTNLYSVAIDDDALTTLAQDDADWAIRRQVRLPTLIFSGR
jgi:hypothetical protein